MVRAPIEDGNIMFLKLGIKDRYWKMVVEG